MADYVVHRIRPAGDSRFGIFKVGGKRHLFKQDFETAKEAFSFLRGHHADRKVSVSKVHANWLVFIT
jgi:hypothetical protein